MAFFIYSTHGSLDAAKQALAGYCASGIVRGERPYIDQNLRALKGKRYRVMFPMCLIGLRRTEKGK